MLKTLTTLHTPDLLHALASMGHGDDLAIIDAHFPAASTARRLIRLDAADAPAVLQACLQLMPLDTVVDKPASRMEVVGAPDAIPEVQQALQSVINKAEGHELPMAQIDRESFYQLARQAYAIVVTGERRTYGCVLVKKGVVLDDSCREP